jgi:hypothetical protein
MDGLYSYFRSNENISNLILFENEPTNSVWGERHSHVKPDVYQLSFAEPLVDKRNKMRYYDVL